MSGRGSFQLKAYWVHNARGMHISPARCLAFLKLIISKNFRIEVKFRFCWMIHRGGYVQTGHLSSSPHQKRHQPDYARDDDHNQDYPNHCPVRCGLITAYLRYIQVRWAVGAFKAPVCFYWDVTLFIKANRIIAFHAVRKHYISCAICGGGQVCSAQRLGSEKYGDVTNRL